MKKSHFFNLNITTVLCLLALLLAMTLVAGCSSNVVAPSTSNSNVTTGQADRNPLFEPDATVSGLMGPKGGLLQVKLDGSTPTIFRFPKGALKVETLITISAHVEQSLSGNLAVYDCGPDGTVFDVPLEVTQPMPPSKTAASLFYFNEQSMQWELLETCPVHNGCAKLHIYHFSKYGIGASQAPSDFTIDDVTTE